jgi:hypothetical protein
MRCCLLVLAACAASQSAPQAPHVPAPTARSSVAAVLQHSNELALTPEQEDTLQRLDNELADKNEALRAQARQHHDDAAAQADSPPMGQRGRRGMRGSPGAHASRPDGSALAGKLDDNDTQTYLEAEKALTDAQRPRARDYASKYREELSNYRQARQTPE